jgi:hypothetical protein
MDPFDPSQFTNAQHVHSDSLQEFPYWQVDSNNPFTGLSAFIHAPPNTSDHAMRPPETNVNEPMSSSGLQSFGTNTFSSSGSNDMPWDFSPGTLEPSQYTQEGLPAITLPTLPASTLFGPNADSGYMTASGLGPSEVSANLNGPIAMTQFHGHVSHMSTT